MRFLIVCVGFPLSIAAGVVAWHIGENITPQTVAMMSAAIAVMGGALLGLLALGLYFAFASRDNANRRKHETARQRNGPRQLDAQAPVVVLFSGVEPGRIAEHGNGRRWVDQPGEQWVTHWNEEVVR